MKIKMWLQSGLLLGLAVMFLGVAAAKDYTWEFKSSDVLEGWTLEGLTNKAIVAGALKVTATRGNPYIFTPRVEIDADNQGFVKFRMRLGKGLPAKGCILFVTEEHPQLDDASSVSFECYPDGEMHEYEVGMSKNPLWKGKVTQLRFQPFAVQWPLPEPQREVEIGSFRIINMAMATGAYGGYGAKSTSSPAVAVTFTNTMSAQYIRLEKDGTGGVNFSELYAYDKGKTNVALRKPVRVSDLAWGNGTKGNDGHCAHNNHVMIRSSGSNWWEVDLGKEMPLTHVVIHDRRAGSLNGAVFFILDRKRNLVASCQMDTKIMKAVPAVTVNSADARTTIPMDKAYFHKLDLIALFGIKSDSPGNIFASTKGKLRMVVPEAEKLASGKVTLFDLEGRSLQTIPLSRGTGDYAIPLPGKGYYTVTATAAYDGGLVLNKETSAAVIGEPLDRQTRLRSIFGAHGKGRAFTELGAAWSWTGIMTHHTRKTDSGYEWLPAYADRVKDGKFDLSAEVNNIVLLTWLPEYMQSVPRSQRGNCRTSPPNDYEEFIRFIKWVVSFIPDYVKYLGPIAEPSWSFKGSPAELAKYHEVIAKAVREVRPDIRVIGPMMSPGNSISLESIKKLDKLGMFAHLDGISINPYIVSWPTPPRSRMPEADFIEFVDAVIQYFASTGRPDYPVYITEFGWYVGPGPGHVDELNLACYSSRAALLLATRPVIKMMNFFMLSGGGGFSYLNFDGTPRPVYPVMAHTFRWLSDCSSGVSTRLTPTLYLAAFKKGDKTGIALWDTKSDSSANIPIRSVKRISDMLGRNVVVENGKIMASQSPLFIDFADDSLLSCLSSAATVPGVKLTPGQSADIGDFDEVIMPEVFLRNGATITAATNAAPGEYRLLGKADGKWRMVVFTISAQ